MTYFQSNYIFSFTLEWHLSGRIQLQAGKDAFLAFERKENQSISDLTLVTAEELFRNYFHYYLKRVAQHANKLAGVWTWHNSTQDQFEMMEQAEILQLSNLWLHSAADSWHFWMILRLFFSGSKLYSLSTMCSLEPKTSVGTGTSAGLKLDSKTKGLQNKRHWSRLFLCLQH